LGQSQILPYLARLSRHGYRFTVLSFEKAVRYQQEGPVVQAIADQAHIRWVPLTFTAQPPVISKMYDRYRMWQSALALQRQNRFDLIHCRSYPAAETGLRLKKKYGVKMLFDMRGFWADEKVDNGQWNQRNPLFRQVYRHYKQKEKEFLIYADGIISLTQAAKNYLLQQPAYAHLSIEVIPCCADLEHFNYTTVDPEEVTTLRTRLHIPAGAKVITYLGSVGGWYMTREMFSFFKVLLQKHTEYVMLVLTKDDAEKVKKEAEATGVPGEKIRVTYSDRKRLPQFLALSHCSIFFIRNTFSKTASSPTKHAELMGMGIPVICNSIGDTGSIIEATQTGLVVNSFNERAYDQVIQGMDAFTAPDREKIRHSAFQYFDLSVGIDRYLSLYKKILA
jgi:glycosyltransferase involved in cell wall biosynthesis